MGFLLNTCNNLFPIKDDDGKTVKLIVVSPGYVMEFEVDPDAMVVE